MHGEGRFKSNNIVARAEIKPPSLYNNQHFPNLPFAKRFLMIQVLFDRCRLVKLAVRSSRAFNKCYGDIQISEPRYQ